MAEGLRNSLNGKTLANAVSEGLITNDADFKFVVLKTTWTGEKAGDNERLMLSCKEGHIPFSKPLEGAIDQYVDQLGDLVISGGISWSDPKYNQEVAAGSKVQRPYFHLQRPSNGLTQVVEDAVIEGVTVA